MGKFVRADEERHCHRRARNSQRNPRAGDLAYASETHSNDLDVKTGVITTSGCPSSRTGSHDRNLTFLATNPWGAIRIFCLIDEGDTVDPKRESYDFGKFGWVRGASFVRLRDDMDSRKVNRET